MKQLTEIKSQRRTAGASLQLVPETAGASLRLVPGIKEIAKVLAVPSIEVAANNTRVPVTQTSPPVNTNNSNCKRHQRRCNPYQVRLHALLPLVTLPIALAVINAGRTVSHISMRNNTHQGRNIPHQHHLQTPPSPM
jgi:hypothetical protein